MEVAVSGFRTIELVQPIRLESDRVHNDKFGFVAEVPRREQVSDEAITSTLHN